MAKRFIQNILKRFGFEIINLKKQKAWPTDFEPLHQDIAAKAQPYTLTSKERIFGLIESVKYISQHKIEGDIVECGVWKGGSMLAIAETLVRLNDSQRELYLYDTFEGMPAPGDADVSYEEKKAEQFFIEHGDRQSKQLWASDLDSVRKNLSLSSYPAHRFHFVEGKVEDTIPGTIPEKIALLRLDTDWYESTKHEMEHLFPRLVKGGILIIDDYGYWKGARKAVDEYFSSHSVQMFLSRMDETGRVGVKL